MPQTLAEIAYPDGILTVVKNDRNAYDLIINGTVMPNYDADHMVRTVGRYLNHLNLVKNNRNSYDLIIDGTVMPNYNADGLIRAVGRYSHNSNTA